MLVAEVDSVLVKIIGAYYYLEKLIGHFSLKTKVLGVLAIGSAIAAPSR